MPSRLMLAIDLVRGGIIVSGRVGLTMDSDVTEEGSEQGRIDWVEGGLRAF